MRLAQHSPAHPSLPEIAFSSGGQSGMVIVYGIPSMRLLKYIAVFNPEPWQAYGFDEESKAVLDQGRMTFA